MKFLISLCVLFATFAVTGAVAVSAQSSTRPSVRFIEVDRDVKLQVVDWGGSGRPIVLLAGLGVTARDFDGFAQALTSAYHVVGITRRGFAPSSIPTTGYLADRLADDVLAVMDSLKLQRPVLVGHSVAGQELSSIGTRFPNRVAGLVYLDATNSYAFYDRSVGNYRVDLNEAERHLRELSSAPARNQAALIAQLLEHDLPALERSLKARQAVLPARDSSALRATTQAVEPRFDLQQAILEGHQRYSSINVPVLAIVALPHRIRPRVASDPRQLAQWQIWEAQDAVQADAVERGIAGARVVRLPNADHFVHQSNEADVLREIRAFIGRLPM